MKLIKDKELLQNIAHQVNLLNTIGGGVSETYVDVKKYKKGAVIEVWAAAVNPELFRVMLNVNQLTILSAMHSEENPQILMPLFSRTFELPPQVDLTRIEAVYQEGQLQIRLPYVESADQLREIEIKQL